MIDVPRPTIERGQHPLLTGNYTLQTPPIDRFAGFIGHLLEFNLPGGYAWGNSRIGKSRVRSDGGDHHSLNAAVIELIRLDDQDWAAMARFGAARNGEVGPPNVATSGSRYHSSPTPTE